MSNFQVFTQMVVRRTPKPAVHDQDMRVIQMILFVTVVVAALAWMREPSLDRLAVTLAASAAVAQARPHRCKAS